MDANIFNATFWITISGVISALVVALITAFNKSKCKEVSCCCLKCIRDTKAEVELEEHRIDHNLPDTPRNLNIASI
jgi:hypothetical protein